MRKRILFVDHDTFNTGSTVSMNYLIEKFRDEGYDVFVLTPKNPSESLNIFKAGASIFRFNSKFINTLMLDLHFTDRTPVLSVKGFIIVLKNLIKVFVGLKVTLNAIREIHPDMIYVNEYVVIQSSIIGYYLRIPTAIHVRSRFLEGTFGFRRYLIARAIVKFNDLVFTITSLEKDQLKIKKVEECKVKIIGEFLSKKNFHIPEDVSELKKQFGIPEGVKVILMFGGILKMKGTLDFLLAAQKVLQLHENVTFIIAGKEFNRTPEERQYYQDCMALINAEALKPFIKITGHIDNPEELMACSDIFVSPITESQFSRPVIEAWALKKTVISYRNAHAENLIKDGIDGLLVACGRYDELADSMLKLLSNESYSCTLGENGYKKAVKEFNPDSTLSKIFNYCNQLLQVEGKKK